VIIHISLEAPFTYLAKQPQRDIEVAPGTTAAALESIIGQAEPIIRKMVPGCGQGSALVLAVDGNRLQPDYQLQHGDHVQVFAPVSGG